MRKSLLILTLVLGSLTAIWAGGQSSSTNDAAAVKAAAAAYSAAIAKGDLDSILACWAADADYMDENGKTYQGREAIGNLLRQNLDECKNCQFAVSLQSVRFFKPDVAIADGTFLVTPKDGAADQNRFTSVWVKTDGKWMIASARDLPDLDDSPSDRQMKSLEWLVGEWTAQDKDTTVRLTCNWVLNKKYLKMDFVVKGDKDMTVVQVVGWDAAEECMRSWMFDSRGGHGGGTWMRNGNSWEGQTTGVLPNGQLGSAICVFRSAGPNAFTWHSRDREVNGSPIPDYELKYTRVGASR